MTFAYRARATWMTGILSLALVTAASAAELVVIEARGGPYKVGEKVDGSAPITLTAGQKLSLIAQNGATVKLRGPFEGPPAPEGAAAEGGNVVTALLNLGRQTESTSSTLGVVRAGSDERVAPDPRAMDITRPGHRCLLGEAQAVLWWPDRGDGGGKIEITPADRSWSARAAWPENSDRMALPANLPLRDGQTYMIEIGKVSAALVVHVVPAELSTEAVRAAWMLEKGCFGQAVALARTESP